MRVIALLAGQEWRRMQAMSQPSSAPLRGISSMATKAVLALLLAEFQRRPGGAGPPVAIESVGGVDAARRIEAGEPFDVVILAADVIDRLITRGHLQPGSRVDLLRSPVAVAVPAGVSLPDISSEAALRAAVMAAPRVGYSTGPSGQHLQRLFARWGVADEVAARTVQAPPGVPVGSLLASGEVTLGFQQWSELMHQPGIHVLGLLPPDCACITTFAAALGMASAQAGPTQELLRYLASPATAAIKRQHGMEPA
jgi:molybdate transport system substrate-binding protein